MVSVAPRGVGVAQLWTWLKVLPRSSEVWFADASRPSAAYYWALDVVQTGQVRAAVMKFVLEWPRLAPCKLELVLTVRQLRDVRGVFRGKIKHISVTSCSHAAARKSGPPWPSLP